MSEKIEWKGITVNPDAIPHICEITPKKDTYSQETVLKSQHNELLFSVFGLRKFEARILK